jgi:tetratricopeptide (TPR) repeat protein
MESPTEVPASLPLDPPSLDARPGQTLGDFKLVRQIGQGGMGVVYEAVQLSLGRHVALKVLPFAAALDSRRLQRFKNEAQAAALLHHANIVPVHAVGCEQGVYFYAMQLIDGATLADVIRGLHDPDGSPAMDLTGPYLPTALSGSSASTRSGFSAPGRGPDFYRAVARVGIQATDALDHAHAHGVIHRDIKPANLMLQPDGHLWVTDFGLAQLADDVQLTRTGDLIGTLRYMSPEQALARRVVIDHRTDIYSLGVTLYELLTGRPAFSGADRQELLRQIAFEEPIAPRRLDRAIPVELETIVLKAMAKNPADRYASASELAEDLRAFVDDRPIRARRPSLVERLGRWGRRHRALVGSGVAVLLVAVVALALSTWLVWQQKEQTRVERDRAAEEEVRAVEAARIARQKEEEARQALAREAAQRRRAEQLLGLGLQTLDEMFIGAAAYRLMRGQPTSLEDRQQMQRAVVFLELFTKQTTDDPAAQRQIAAAYSRLANLHSQLGAHDRAIAAAKQAVKLAEKLADGRPNDSDRAAEVAMLLGRLGVIHDLAGQVAEAEKAHQRALRLERQLADQYPDRPELRGRVAATLHNLAMIRNDHGDHAEVVRLLREAIVFQKAVLRGRKGRVQAYEHYFNHCSLLGNALLVLGRHDEAVRAYYEAHRVALYLADRSPAEVGAWQQLARSYANLGGALRHTDQAGAEEPTRRGLLMRLRLVEAFPGVPAYTDELARSHYGWADVCERKGQLDAAEAHYRRGMVLMESLTEQFPNLARYRTLLVRLRKDLVLLLCRRGRPADAGLAELHDLAVLTQLAEERPGWRDIRVKLAEKLGRLGQRLWDEGRSGDALCTHLRACQVLQPLAGESARAWLMLGLCLSNLGRCWRDLGQIEEAQEVFAQAEQLLRSPGLARKDGRYHLAACLNERGLAHYQAEEFRHAEQAYKESIALLEKMQAEGDRDARVRRLLGGTLHNLAKREWKRRRLDRARQLLERAVREQRAAFTALPRDRMALRFLRNHYQTLVELLKQQGRSAEAADACRRYLEDFADRIWYFGGVAGYLRNQAMWRLNQGILLRQAKQLDDAAQVLQATVKTYRQLGNQEPADRSERARALHVLAWVRVDQQRPGEAVALLRQAIEEQRAAVAAASRPTRITAACCGGTTPTWCASCWRRRT